MPNVVTDPSKEAERTQRLPYYQTAKEEKFKDLDSMRDYLKSQDRKTTLVDNFSKLNFNQDSLGKLQLDFGQGPKSFTETGFKIFCKTLKIPPKYLETLPHENMVKDTFASIAKSKHERINFITKDNKIVGCSPKEDLTSTEEVVNKLFETNHKNVRELTYRNEEFFISFIRDTIIPLPNDQLETGIAVHHNDGLGNHPDLSHYAYRLVCTNGLKTWTLEPVATFSNRMSKDRMFDAFNGKIEETIGRINNSLSEAVKRMSSTMVPTEDKKFYRAYLSSKMSFGDHVEFSSDFENLITNNPNSTFYDVMNFITNAAKVYAVDEKSNMERLGGDMLAYFKSYKPALDVFSGFTEFKRKRIHKEALKNG